MCVIVRERDLCTPEFRRQNTRARAHAREYVYPRLKKIVALETRRRAVSLELMKHGSISFFVTADLGPSRFWDALIASALGCSR